MATNREILFILKMKNAAQAAMRAMGSDWQQIGQQAKAAATAANTAATAASSVAKATPGINGVKGGFAGIAMTATTAKATIGSLMGQMGTLFGLYGSGQLLRGMVAGSATFEQQMQVVKAVSGATGKEFNDLRNAALSAAGATEFTATEGAQGLEFFARAGFTAQQAMQALSPALDMATADGMELADVTDVLAQIMGQFRLQATDTAHITDTLATVSASTLSGISDLGWALSYAGTAANAFNVKMNTTVASLGILADAGLRGTIAGTAIRSMMMDLGNLAEGAGTVKQKNALAAMGLTPADIDLSKNGLVGVLETLKKVNPSVAQLNAVFGERGVVPVKNLMEGIDKLKALEASTVSVNGKAKEMADTIRDSLSVDWKKFVAGAMNVGISVMKYISPYIRTFLQFGTAVMTALSGGETAGMRFGDVAKSLAPILQALAIPLGLLVARLTLASALMLVTATRALILGPALAGVGAAANLSTMQMAIQMVSLRGAVSGVSALFGGLGSVVSKVPLAVFGNSARAATGIVTSLGRSAVVATTGFGTMVAGIGKMAAGITRATVGILLGFTPLTGVANVFKGLFTTLSGGFKTLSGVGRAALTILISPFTMLRAALGTVFTGLRAVWVLLAANPIGAVVAVITGLVIAYYKWKDVVVSIGNRTTTMSDIVTVAINRIKGLIPALNAAWGTVKTSVIMAFSAVSSALYVVWDEVKSYVNKIIGVWVGSYEAIKSAWDNLPAALEGIGKTAANALIGAIVWAINGIIGNIRKLFAMIDSVSNGSTNFAGMIGADIDPKDWELEMSKPAADAAQAAQAAFSEGFNRDFIGSLPGVFSAGVQNFVDATMGDLLDEAARETANNAQNERTRLRTLTGSMNTTGGAPPVIRNEEDPVTNDGGVGGSSGGGTGSKLSKLQEKIQSLREEAMKALTDAKALGRVGDLMRDYGINKEDALKVAEITEEAKALGMNADQVNALTQEWGELMQVKEQAIREGQTLSVQFGIQWREMIANISDATSMAGDIVGQLSGISTSIINDMVDNQTSAMDALQNSAANAFKSIGKMLMDYALKVLIFKNLLGSIGGGGVGSIGAFFSSMVGGPTAAAKGGEFGVGAEPSLFAKGGEFGQVVRETASITKFAKGGEFTNTVVTSPTPFRFATGGGFAPGVMGEAGPEAVVPLTRGKGGRLGVTVTGGDVAGMGKELIAALSSFFSAATDNLVSVARSSGSAAQSVMGRRELVNTKEVISEAVSAKSEGFVSEPKQSDRDVRQHARATAVIARDILRNPSAYGIVGNTVAKTEDAEQPEVRSIVQPVAKRSETVVTRASTYIKMLSDVVKATSVSSVKEAATTVTRNILNSRSFGNVQSETNVSSVREVSRSDRSAVYERRMATTLNAARVSETATLVKSILTTRRADIVNSTRNTANLFNTSSREERSVFRSSDAKSSSLQTAAFQTSSTIIRQMIQSITQVQAARQSANAARNSASMVNPVASAVSGVRRALTERNEGPISSGRQLIETFKEQRSARGESMWTPKPVDPERAAETIRPLIRRDAAAAVDLSASRATPVAMPRNEVKQTTNKGGDTYHIETHVTVPRPEGQPAASDATQKVVGKAITNEIQKVVVETLQKMMRPGGLLYRSK